MKQLDSSEDTLLRKVLNSPGVGKAQQIASVVTLGVALYETGKQWRNRARNTYEHTVSVQHDDEIYEAVHRYVLAQLPTAKQRSLTLRSGLSDRRDHDDGLVEAPSYDANQKRKPVVRLFYDGTREQRVTIKGHSVRVLVDASEHAFNRDGKYTPLRKEKITFTARNTAGREAVVAWLTELNEEERRDTRSRLNIGTAWGGWNTMYDLPRRDLETVVLAAGQRERILADLQRFLASEQLYSRVGLPWHRGYMFHGPPGTGKTSLAKALADYLELDLYFVPLSDLREDTHLLDLLARVPARSVLILEDIDVVHAAKERDDSEVKGLTMSGLLQALDGMVTPHGMITILTTNYLEVIDDSLLRTGRVDVTEELGYAGQDQAERIVTTVLGRPPRQPLPPVPARLTPAELIEPAKPHLHDLPQAEQAIRDLLAARNEV